MKQNVSVLIIVMLLVVGGGSYVYLKRFINEKSTSKLTQQKVIELVKNRKEVKEYLIHVPKGIVTIDHKNNDNNSWIIHVFEIVNNHTATFNWYEVKKNTGKVEIMFDILPTPTQSVQ